MRAFSCTSKERKFCKCLSLKVSQSRKEGQTKLILSSYKKEKKQRKWKVNQRSKVNHKQHNIETWESKLEGTWTWRDGWVIHSKRRKVLESSHVDCLVPFLLLISFWPKRKHEKKRRFTLDWPEWNDWLVTLFFLLLSGDQDVSFFPSVFFLFSSTDSSWWVAVLRKHRGIRVEGRVYES